MITQRPQLRGGKGGGKSGEWKKLQQARELPPAQPATHPAVGGATTPPAPQEVTDLIQKGRLAVSPLINNRPYIPEGVGLPLASSKLRQCHGSPTGLDSIV